MTVTRIIPFIALIQHLHRLRHINRLMDACSGRVRAGLDSAGVGNEVALVVAKVDGAVRIALGSLGWRVLAATHVSHLAERDAGVVLVAVGAVGRGAVFADFGDDEVDRGQTGTDDTDTSFGVSRFC